MTEPALRLLARFGADSHAPPAVNLILDNLARLAPKCANRPD